jgi:hypothetical protein
MKKDKKEFLPYYNKSESIKTMKTDKKEFLQKLADLMEEYKATCIAVDPVGYGIDICFADDDMIGLSTYNERNDIRINENIFENKYKL